MSDWAECSITTFAKPYRNSVLSSSLETEDPEAEVCGDVPPDVEFGVGNSGGSLAA